MSRRQNRKRRRNQERRDRLHDTFPYEPVDPTAFIDIDDTFLNLAHFERPVAKACGSCYEFIEDHEVGRGTCLHPASGVFAPWYDTPACPYYRRS